MIYLLPFLPVIFFFLHNATNFTQLIFTPDVLILLIAYLLFSFLFFHLLKRIFKLNRAQAIFLSTMILTVFLFFGAEQDYFYTSRPFHFLSNSLLLLFIQLTFIILLFRAYRKKPILARINFYLLTLFSIFIIIDSVMLVIKLVNGNNVAALSRNMTTPVITSSPASPRDEPDIYHILFDSYTNATCLRKYWNTNNEIYPYLESKGFFTGDSTFSNYLSTPFSMASIFNMQYLEGAEPYLYSNSSNFYIGQRVYKKNELFRFLKTRGYAFSLYSQLENKKMMTSLGALGVSLPNDWLRKQTVERIFLNPWIREKLNALFGKKHDRPPSIQKSIEAFHTFNLNAMQHIQTDCREATRKNDPKPLFSFTHFLLPHDPYIVDENGKPIAYPLTENTNMEGYLKQLKYANKLIRRITECLLSDTTRNKIIIFHGDHGYRHFSHAENMDHFAALEAVYFYDRDYKGFTKSGSLVNLYRIILNKFYHFNLPLLPDKIVNMSH